MKKLKEKQQGITLVALVITVIIIIILATVTINMAFGDNGLITQAQRAKDMMANSTVAEQEGINGVMSEYLNVMGEESEIPLPDPVPDIPGGEEAVETGAIAFTNPTWSNEKASVTISTNTSYTLQYQVVSNEGASNDANWQVVPGGGIICNLNHRDIVYARLIEGSYYGEEASATVKDETPPTISNMELEATDTTVKVTVTASDSESGIGSYTYEITGGETANNQTGNTYTFNGLNSSTPYTIQVTVTDRASNPVTESKSITTTAPPGIPESTSYVGYYADVDGNGSVDGIIYADLAQPKSGQWTNSSGTYSYTNPGNLKKYEVEGSYTANGFGTKGIVKPAGESGNDRFYVMALSNVDSSTHQFWSSGGTSVVTSTDFGTGESNTAAMRIKSGSSSYLWGLSAVQNGTWNGSSGWYVPSRGEWAAFEDAFDITSSDYTNYGLSGDYWSSSQNNMYNAWYANFGSGYMLSYGVNRNNCVRLGTTF